MSGNIKIIKLKYCSKIAPTYHLAGARRIEHRRAVLETAVLPLNYAPMYILVFPRCLSNFSLVIAVSIGAHSLFIATYFLGLVTNHTHNCLRKLHSDWSG